MLPTPITQDQYICEGNKEYIYTVIKLFSPHAVLLIEVGSGTNLRH